MHFHLLLLISPVFGMPAASDMIENGEDIIKQLDSLSGFTEENAMFKAISKLYERVTGSLSEAQQNVLELNVIEAEATH